MTQSPTRDPAGAEMEEIGFPVGCLPKTETTPLIEVTSAGTATVVRLPHHAAVSDCALDHRARRCDPVAISDLS